jgi:hypothetical protein
MSFKSFLFWRLLVFVLSFNLLSPFFAKASGKQIPFSKFYQMDLDNAQIRHLLFLLPNENLILEIAPMTLKALPGAYMGVGTERTFLAFASNPNFTHLIAVDMNPYAVLYNRINAGLLFLSTGLEDYLEIRKSLTPYSEIQNRIDQLPKVQKASFLKNYSFVEEEFSWWTRFLKQRDLLSNDEAFAFSSANYLIPSKDSASDKPANRLYERLVAAARSFRIRTKVLDFLNFGDVYSFAQSLEGIEQISLLDLSNAWTSEFLGVNNLRIAVDQWTDRLNPKAILMLTYFDLEKGEYLNYLSFHLDEIMKMQEGSPFGVQIYTFFAVLESIESFRTFSAENNIFGKLDPHLSFSVEAMKSYLFNRSPQNTASLHFSCKDLF